MALMSEGKFVVIEGSDASGKKTQAKLLIEMLSEKGIDARLLDFPTYETLFGELISRYLRGELGQLNEITPEIPSMLYALDRHQYKGDIEADLAEGKFLVANRYCQSNWAYQGAKFQDKEERNRFIIWLKDLESRIPQPDLVIYLYTPTDISAKLIESREDKGYLKGEKMDIHESDRQFQESVARVYLDLTRELEDWALVECAGDGGMKSIGEINADIVSVLKERGLL